MEKIKEIQVEEREGIVTTHIFIDKGNGEFTTMPKWYWDELQAKQTEGGLK